MPGTKEPPLRRMRTGVCIGRAHIRGASCIRVLLCIAVIAPGAAVLWSCGDTGRAVEQGCDHGSLPGAAPNAGRAPGAARHGQGDGSDSGSDLPEGVSRSAESSNLFGLDLYACLKARAGNLLFSPLSVTTVLSMVHAGAGGRTRDEMASTLHLDQNGTELRGSISALGQRLIHRDAAGSLDIAHALWMQEGNEYRRQYLDYLQQCCRAGAFTVDFVRAPAWPPSRKMSCARGSDGNWTGSQDHRKPG